MTQATQRVIRHDCACGRCSSCLCQWRIPAQVPIGSKLLDSARGRHSSNFLLSHATIFKMFHVGVRSKWSRGHCRRCGFIAPLDSRIWCWQGPSSFASHLLDFGNLDNLLELIIAGINFALVVIFDLYKKLSVSKQRNKKKIKRKLCSANDLTGTKNWWTTSQSVGQSGVQSRLPASSEVQKHRI